MITQVTIYGIAFGGYGIARIDGKVVFVDYAVPEDILEVEIYSVKKNFSFARIQKIISPSPLRIQPLCGNFAVCGGCSYQNVSYETELNLKKEITVDLLKRIAGLSIEQVPDIDVISGERTGYRSHASVKVADGAAGFYKKESDSLVEFPPGGCALLCKELNDGIQELELSGLPKDVRVSCDCHSSFHYSTDPEMIHYINEFDFETHYRHDINGFYQANRFLRNSMIQRVIDYAAPCLEETFMDICCGCGFFSIPVARLTAKGFGYDSDGASVSNAIYNAGENGIRNLNFEVKSEAAIHPFRQSIDFIVVDPPRAGISKKGRRTINSINPERIVYISCDPSTFARDARDFISSGYRLEKVTMIDMFPCTKHIELITKISR